MGDTKRSYLKKFLKLQYAIYDIRYILTGNENNNQRCFK
jgi:hypothetical protein